MFILKDLAVTLFTEETLRRFKWYRERRGGVWVYSNTFGWRQEPPHLIGNLLASFKSFPSLWNYGKDIEDYRVFDEF